MTELGEDDSETKAARGSLGELYRRNGKANEGARVTCRADVAALSGLD